MATKATPADIKALQFVPEEFNGVTDFDAFLQGVLDEQEALLTDRVGAATVSNPALVTHIKRVEKCLTAAELLQMRINRLSGNLDANTAGLISQLKKARQDYQDEAERIIPRLVAGSVSDGSDGAFGFTSSSHFDSDQSALFQSSPITGRVY
jgi:hypothetical protein